jgi:hypothetical protein
MSVCRLCRNCAETPADRCRNQPKTGMLKPVLLLVLVGLFLVAVVFDFALITQRSEVGLAFN